MHVRRAAAADRDVMVDVYLSSREAAGAAIPPGVHSRDEVTRYVRDVVIARHETWLMIDGDDAAGVLALDEDEVEWLYVRPGAQRCGIGGALLEHAKQRRPGGLALWVFATNTPAITFYTARGFRAVASTDGDNEEGAPDIRVVWGSPSRPH